MERWRTPSGVGEPGRLRVGHAQPTELSAVCAFDLVPPGTQCEGPWRILAVRGPLDFALTGVMASLATPLADAGVSLFAVSTHDTDYLLVRAADLDRAVAALRAAGHRLRS